MRSLRTKTRPKHNDRTGSATASSRPLENFQRTLENHAGKKIQLRINDNHSTMLSVRWEPDRTRVSLHRMFLDAPKNVMQALGSYLNGRKRELAPAIKAYIEQCRTRLDYSHAVDPQHLCHQGEYYDLQQLYDEINAEYFDNQIDLMITWFGMPYTRNRTRISFGLYQDTLRLIKINRILDKAHVPCYLLKYVIYHEMLHHVCPPRLDENGIYRIHNEEFKERETKYRYFRRATEWIRENREDLFAGAI